MINSYFRFYKTFHLISYSLILGLLLAGAALTLRSFLEGPVSAASGDIVLANSSGINGTSDSGVVSSGTIYDEHYSLKQYWNMRGQADWPQGCSPTRDKYMPWLAANGQVPSEYVGSGTLTDGNNISTDGNCVNRYSDGGDTYRNGWLDNNGWADPGGSAGFPGVATDGPRSTVSCSGVTGTPRWIWSSSSPDLNNQQYYGAYTVSDGSGYGLYSNGTTLFRQNFTITQTQMDQINAGKQVVFYAVADDWLHLYVNGTSIPPTKISKQSVMSQPLIKSLLHSGSNTIAFQVSDKGVWTNSDNSTSRQSGICYSLNIVDGGTVVGSSDCPLDPSAAVNATQHPLSLSTTSRSPSSTGTVSGYGDIPDARYGYGYEPSGDFTLNSVSDNYGQPTTFTGASKSPGPFTADYSTYIKSYPYDSHVITAYYSVWYDQYEYRSSSTPTYYCTSGTVSGTSCVFPVTTTYSCTKGAGTPGGGGHSQSECWSYQLQSDGSLEWVYVGPATPSYSCPSGGTYNGSTCYGGPALKHYKITKGAMTSHDYDSQTTSKVQSPIGQCYARQFTVSWNPQPTSGSLDSAEDPTAANFSGTISVHFYGAVDSKGLRNPSKVQLSVNDSSIVTPSYVSPYGPCNGSDIYIQSAMSSPDDESGSGSITCPIKAPPLRAGDVVCADFVISPAQGSIINNGATMTDTFGQLEANPCTSNEVTNQPYAHFFGNGVAAGGAFAGVSGVCSATAATSLGDISANIEDRSPAAALMRGSGTQYEAIATGSAASFITANLRSNDPMSKFGLTFSNTSAGQLGAAHCAPNFMAGAPKTSDSLTLDSGRQVITDVLSGNQTINGGSQLYMANGISRTIYVSGNATINANIFYQTDGWKKIGVNSTNIPTFYLIASGNINISGNVSRLDGVYVAQGGTINTCYQQDFGVCDKQLTINGSFIADNIQLYRTFSSLRNSTGGEWPDPTGLTPNDNPGSNCDLGDNAQWSALVNPNRSSAAAKKYDCAAEIFNFNPATYLVRPNMTPVGGDSATHYDSIASLAPVL